MKKIFGIENFNKKRFKKPVIAAIGTFDGVHLAHRTVIGCAVRQAKKTNGTSVVLTFYPHPMRIIAPEKKPALLTSIEHRLELIDAIGPDICLVAKFKKSFSKMPACRFIETVLIDALNVSKVIIGDNFTFGNDKSGNIDFLKEYAGKAGFKVQVIPALKKSGKIVSSSLIRRFVESGNLETAEKFLGRRFSVLGTVVKGDSRGTILGYPTANIDPHQEALPPEGVYAVLARIDKKWHKGMLNIGRRPTFYGKSGQITIEANVFDFDKYIYGQVIELSFIKKIRNEKNFNSPDMLKQQLQRDREKVLKIL